MKYKTIAVIGLGQFGTTIAKMLASMNHEVLGVDINPEIVQKVSPYVTHAIVADTTDEEAIKALALSQFDIVIVAIGDNIQANLMTSMLLKEMNMPHVVSKAENALQGKMLKKMGVDMVIYPEYDVAQRLAQSLTREHVMDYLQLSKSISLIEVDMPKFLVGTCLKDSNPILRDIDIFKNSIEDLKAIDSEFIEGKKSLLFGPFAGFTMKYLKHGSQLDFPLSFKPDNFATMVIAGIKNIPLTDYLIKQALLNKEQRMADLREFYPEAKSEDWDVIIAGQRVQIIKDLANERGSLCFGTEVITSEDKSVAALLGASPGASTSVDAMLSVFSKCFVEKHPELQVKLKQIVPSYGEKLRDKPELIHEIRSKAEKWLGV